MHYNPIKLSLQINLRNGFIVLLETI